MKTKIEIIKGPPTSKVTKEAAERQLLAHPQFPKGASYTLDDVEGRWIAAISKVAGPPAFADDEGGESPAPESDGPPSDDAPSDEGPDLGPPDDDEGPSEEKGEKKEEKGEKGELNEIKELLTVLLTALGLSPGGPEDSPVPGPDGAGPDGPPGPPPGGPEGGPDGGHEKQVVRHERSLKPGESAPGTTPVGAPSFSSVSDDHPWKAIIGKKRTFPVEEEIGDATLASVRSELSKLAKGTGYEIKQLREGRTSDGRRTAKALIGVSA